MSLQTVIQGFLTYSTSGNYLEVASWTSWWLCAVSPVRRAPGLPAVMQAGCLMDFAFAHGRKQSSLVAGHLKPSSRQAAGWKEEKKPLRLFSLGVLLS